MNAKARALCHMKDIKIPSRTELTMGGCKMIWSAMPGKRTLNV